MARTKLDVKQAAHVLGISTDAVHKRAKRGTLESEKDEDGRVFVWLDTEDNSYTSNSQAVHPLLVARLENENEFLRQELERRSEELSEMRRIVAGLVQRVPELPAPAPQEEPQEPHQDAAGVPEGPGDQDAPGGREEAIEGRSWWRRWFGRSG